MLLNRNVLRREMSWACFWRNQILITWHSCNILMHTAFCKVLISQAHGWQVQSMALMGQEDHVKIMGTVSQLSNKLVYSWHCLSALWDDMHNWDGMSLLLNFSFTTITASRTGGQAIIDIQVYLCECLLSTTSQDEPWNALQLQLYHAAPFSASKKWLHCTLVR